MNRSVRRIDADDGAILRDIRLRSLEDAPTAFEKTFAEEVAYPDDHWDAAARDRADGDDDATFLCGIDTTPIGLVGTYRTTSGWFQLVSMWVAPEHRRTGVATLLIDVVVAMARRSRAPGVYLWVNSENTPAIEVYRRSGFAFDGEAKPLGAHEGMIEQRMRMPFG